MLFRFLLVLSLIAIAVSAFGCGTLRGGVDAAEHLVGGVAQDLRGAMDGISKADERR